MYNILTEASINQITGFPGVQVKHGASIWSQFANLPLSTCPNRSNIQYMHQTRQCASGMCYKSGFLQLICVHLCCKRERHFDDIMLPPGLLCCSDKITAVFRRRKTNVFAASGFHKIPLPNNLLRMCAYNYTLLENYLYIQCVPSLRTMLE